MFTSSWLRDALERAVKSAAQAVVLGIGMAEGFNLFAADWQNIAGLSAGAFLLSLLTSVISAPFGKTGTASVVKVEAVPFDSSAFPGGA